MTIFRNFSIKNKLVIIVLMVSIPALVLGFSFIFITDIVQLRKDLVNNNRLDAALVGEYCISPLALGIDERSKKSGVSEILEKLRAMADVEYGYVYDEKGELVASYPGDSAGISPPPSPGAAFDFFKGRYLHIAHPIIYDKTLYGFVYLKVSTRSLRRSIRSRIISLILVLLGLIVLSYLLALRFQGVISHPILKLARVTENISHHSDYSVRVRREGRDEIGVLYDGFNNMLEQIQLGQKKRDEAEAEQQRLMVRLAEKNKELEQVVYVTSHDLRSPLVNIQGFSQELGYSLKELNHHLEQMEAVPPDLGEKISHILERDIRESLQYIDASTAKMDGLLSGLLKLSRVDRVFSAHGVIDMDHLMSEILKAFEFQLKAAGVSVRLEPLPSCYGNETQVNQVFSNLVSNALKYLDPRRPGKISISGQQSGEDDFAIYCVQDNGIGIPRDHQKKIFEIFHRLNPGDSEGEGLGLAIVSKIVSRHNGRIWVKSQPGKGSRFFVSLPRSERSKNG
jgi:signal transduction histidine kinase